MSLPVGWSVRRPTLDDVPSILAVVHAADTYAIGYPDFDADDVQAALTAPYVDPTRDCWLGLDPLGTVVAWATVENPTGVGRESVDVFADPAAGRAVQVPLLDRQLARVAERAAERGLPALTVRCAAYPPEHQWRAALLDRGFTHAKRYVRMRRPLADLPAEPPVPPAEVTIRQVRPDDEADLRAFHRVYDTAFRDIADYEPLPYERWRARIGDGSAWDEWFFAESDGAPVGVLQSSDQALDRGEGFVKNLAVLPGERKRGVGAALLLWAFHRYAAKGRAFAGLGVDLANPTAPLPLYRSVGLREERTRTIDLYELVVPAAG
ncbi:GNAT family N-acetyltransferase [Micromonospora sp. RTGN7]|uniref:GNAT family N-acetyltransferase n=1 Tax=Micromonospora sp. RTGN7 TaxID=3016526 RepID=UPI0029FF421F|nr:GNAT family N-acetyltransferase [Micromonospora sp. RTGN7]